MNNRSIGMFFVTANFFIKKCACHARLIWRECSCGGTVQIGDNNKRSLVIRPQQKKRLSYCIYTIEN